MSAQPADSSIAAGKRLVELLELYSLAVAVDIRAGQIFAEQRALGLMLNPRPLDGDLPSVLWANGAIDSLQVVRLVVPDELAEAGLK